MGKGSIGTTKKGIGPTYSTKASRKGIRMWDIFDEEHFEKKSFGHWPWHSKSDMETFYSMMLRTRYIDSRHVF